MLSVAQTAPDDWVDIAIYAVVIAIPVLSAIANSLIKRFGGKKGESDRTIAPPPRKVSRRGTEWQRPVARPMPPSRPRPAPTGSAAEKEPKPTWTERVELPEPLRDILSEVMPEVVPPTPPKQARRITRSPDQTGTGQKTVHHTHAAGEPQARPIERHERRTVRSDETRRARPAAPARKSQRKRGVPTAPSGAPVSAAAGDESDVLGDWLGHVESPLGSLGEEWGRRPDESGFDYLRKPDTAALRRAVVMREILSPPLALRHPYDPFAGPQ